MIEDSTWSQYFVQFVLEVISVILFFIINSTGTC